MNNNYMPNFTEFLIEKKKVEGETEDYTPPKYVAQPAVDDKGFGLVSSAFNSQKSYFKPGIKSSNQNLKEHEY